MGELPNPRTWRGSPVLQVPGIWPCRAAARFQAGRMQCAQIGHANHSHTITGYVRENKVGAASLVARATNFSYSEFENSEMPENLRETSALYLFRLYIAYTK